MSRIASFVEMLFRQNYSKRFLRLEEEIIRIAPLIIGGDRILAEGYADRWKNRIWNSLVKRLDEEEKKGLSPTFDVVDSDRMELSWHPFFLEKDASKVKEKKCRLRLRGALLDFIDDDDKVSARGYEAMGCLISELSGSTKWHLTPRGNEFGIDFVATIPAFGKSHLFPSISKEIRIVGQSKKWNSRVKREKVDDLAHKLDYIRKRSKYIDEILPPWFISSKGLLVGCMVSHSGTQSGGHEIARDHGIIISDSRDIAEIIALSKTWDYTLGSDGALDFVKSRLEEILNDS